MKVKDFPWLPSGVTPKLFEVIYYKYTTASEQARGFGKKLAAASAAGTISSVDLPTIIYATRNWHVHGVLLSSSFRGPSKKFELYINTLIFMGCSGLGFISFGAPHRGMWMTTATARASGPDAASAWEPRFALWPPRVRERPCTELLDTPRASLPSRPQ